MARRSDRYAVLLAGESVPVPVPVPVPLLSERDEGSGCVKRWCCGADADADAFLSVFVSVTGEGGA